MKAKAAILFEVGQRLDIREVDVAKPRAGEVLVRMAVGGICHSDLHVMTGHLSAPIPSILGHEGAGTVVEVGSGVTSVRPGDNVIPLWRLSCGECEYCTSARPALCAVGLKIRSTGRLLDGSSRCEYCTSARPALCAVGLKIRSTSWTVAAAFPSTGPRSSTFWECRLSPNTP